ncbi:hypothetical protein PVK06_026765 [Gossypium arboreum]|uniref:Uncharacterized protein n=1 Tax=Gossypium arboreum TaxID=29729 RepID=A0ABR0P1F8_GOSAR|nr:hypothetical protein PVK06_026765 [Gossypium arboreum]
MVVLATIAGFEVKRILVDSGSIVEVLTWVAYKKNGVEEVGDGEHTTTEYVQFFVVDHSIAYNAIFAHPIMRMTKIKIETSCMKVKFPIRIGIGFMQSDHRTARQCHMLSVNQTHEHVQ